MVAALGWTMERKRVLKEGGRRGRLRSVGRWSGPVAWAFSYSKSVSRHHTITSASLFLTLIAQGPAGFRHSLFPRLHSLFPAPLPSSLLLLLTLLSTTRTTQWTSTAATQTLSVLPCQHHILLRCRPLHHHPRLVTHRRQPVCAHGCGRPRTPISSSLPSSAVYCLSSGAGWMRRNASRSHQAMFTFGKSVPPAQMVLVRPWNASRRASAGPSPEFVR
jgi:hypothetical protein